MNQLRTQHTGVYSGLVVAGLFLFFAALGPGLYGHTGAGDFGWQHALFDSVCHQDPDRSFYLNGTLMAVCARCIGIYTCFMIGVLIIPVVDYFVPQSKTVMVKVLVAVVLSNFIDVAGNFFGVWTNTLNSRFLLGSLLGLSAALILTNTFFFNTKIGVTKWTMNTW
ncbi:MAG: DUF2085 domain-containing protein [Balneolaceae bacterium]|nr:DUF2085 domain-containing protein [Balneolaceae bacterium]